MQQLHTLRDFSPFLFYQSQKELGPGLGISDLSGQRNHDIQIHPEVLVLET